MGALVGSFVNVVAYRLSRRDDPVGGRSRYRRRAHSYPIAEVGLAALWAGSVLALGTDSPAELALGLVLCTVLLAITLTDLDRRVIPNVLVFGGTIVGIAIVLAFDLGQLDQRALAAVIAGGVMFLLSFAYPRGMGMGDAKLVAMMGIYLGRAIGPALLVGFAAGAAVGLVMIARHGSEARKRAIPFGPFLALGGVVGLWFGDEISDWYVDDVIG